MHMCIPSMDINNKHSIYSKSINKNFKTKQCKYSHFTFNTLLHYVSWYRLIKLKLLTETHYYISFSESLSFASNDVCFQKIAVINISVSCTIITFVSATVIQFLGLQNDLQQNVLIVIFK